MKPDAEGSNPLPWTAGTVPAPRAQVADRPWLHALLLVLTLITTTMAGARDAGADPGSLAAIARGLPFSLTLLAILLTHEAGHYLMARRHGVAASLPYVLPAPPQIFPLGTLGAVIRVQSRFPDRRALFDMGAAGPWAGFAVALVTMVIGLQLSRVDPAPPDGHAIMLGDSLLTSFLARLVLQAQPDTVVLHPVAFASWVGLLVTSLNLLPAGQLDGGHVLYAARGRRVLLIPLLLLGVLGWLAVNGSPFWVVWGVVAAAMLFLGHPPTMDDARPLGAARQVGAALSLLLFLVTFVPEPIRIVS